jgi:hypothetical protein
MTFNKAEGDLTHYNSIGGFIEYQELIRHMKEYFPNMEALSFDDVNIYYDEDGIPSVEMKDISGIRELDSTFYANFPEIPDNPLDIFGFENNNASLPTVLFMRDSYYNIFDKYVAANFHYSLGIHYSYMYKFRDYIDLYNPDIIVFEVAERQIPAFTPHIINFYYMQMLE